MKGIRSRESAAPSPPVDEAAAGAGSVCALSRVGGSLQSAASRPLAQVREKGRKGGRESRAARAGGGCRQRPAAAPSSPRRAFPRATREGRGQPIRSDQKACGAGMGGRKGGRLRRARLAACTARRQPSPHETPDRALRCSPLRRMERAQAAQPPCVTAKLRNGQYLGSGADLPTGYFLSLRRACIIMSTLRMPAREGDCLRLARPRRLARSHDGMRPSH